MSGMIALEMPREVLHAARMTPGELRRELAIHLWDTTANLESNELAAGENDSLLSPFVVVFCAAEGLYEDSRCATGGHQWNE